MAGNAGIKPIGLGHFAEGQSAMCGNILKMKNLEKKNRGTTKRKKNLLFDKLKLTMS